MKRLFLLLIGLWLQSCQALPRIAPAHTLAGTHAFIEYNTATVNDEVVLIGSLTIASVDDEHVNLTATGMVGTTPVTYSYENVVIAERDDNYLGEKSYQLLYQDKPIGGITRDDRGRYLYLTPESNLTLIAELPTEDA